MPAALWSASKRYGAAWNQITDARKEQKRSQYEQSTLIIKDFKYGPSLSIFVRKLIMRQPTVANHPIFCHDNNTTAEFDSGLEFKE